MFLCGAVGQDRHCAALLFKMHNYQELSMGFGMRMRESIGRGHTPTGTAAHADLFWPLCARLSPGAPSRPRDGFTPFVAMEVR
jgi:hypothetical protein